MGRKILYVDDIRTPPFWYKMQEDEVTIARTFDEAITLLDFCDYDLIDLDNDLGEEKEGYDIVKYIIENNIQIPCFYIHTMNPVARENMKQLLERYTNSKVYIYIK